MSTYTTEWHDTAHGAVPMSYDTPRGTVTVRFASSYRGEIDFKLSRGGEVLGRIRNLADDSYAPGEARAGQWVVTGWPGGSHYGATPVDALDAASDAGAI